jgi:DNA-binding NarL/FixJ family response regulator
MRRDPASPGAEASDVPIRVFLVDHNHSYRAGLRTELGRVFVVAGEAGTAQTAAERILRSRPDVVLLDVHLRGGPAVVETVHMRHPQGVFLATSILYIADDVIGEIRAGARGNISKKAPPAELSNAIRRVQAGDVVVPPRLAGLVLDAFPSHATEPDNNQRQRLTAVERYVLRQLARAFTRDEIADDLGTPVAAVAAHLSATMDKLRLLVRHDDGRAAPTNVLIDDGLKKLP